MTRQVMKEVGCRPLSEEASLRRKDVRAHTVDCYAHFSCPNSECGHSWSSMVCSVQVAYCGPRPADPERTYLCVRTYGQLCRECGCEEFARPRVWRKSAEHRVMMKRIVEFMKSPEGGEQRSRRDHGGKDHAMKSPHQSHLCEACSLGVCTQKTSQQGEGKRHRKRKH